MALTSFLRRLDKLRDRVENFGDDLSKPVRRNARFEAVFAETNNDTDLDFSLPATTGTLVSSDELNAVPTSYAPLGPEFSGAATTSSVTLGGEYDGSAGDDTLTFTALTGGTVGSPTGPIIEVRDGDNNLLQTLSLGLTYTPGDTLTLNNRIEIEFDAGFIEAGDTFDLDVFTSVDSAINPDAAFNGVGNDSAGLEPGEEIRTGSFEINGVSIALSESDSLNDVLSNINSSAAGVTATYDTETESVTLETNGSGPSATITLGDDNSGFLAFANLTDGAYTPGAAGGVGDVNSVIGDLAGLAGISTGTFLVNGETLNVDVDVDTIQDVINRINESDAGVTASFDNVKKRLQFTSDDPEATLTLDDGTSNFISGFRLDTGSFEPTGGRPEIRVQTDRSTQAFERVAAEFNRLFGDLAESSTLQSNLAGVDLKGAIRGAFSEAFGETLSGDKLDTGLGIVFDFSEDADDVVSFDDEEFRQGLRSKSERAYDFLSDEESAIGGGLVARLQSAIERIEDRSKSRLDRLGGALNVFG